MKSPDRHEIKALRKKQGLSQTNAGLLIYKAVRTWQQYEKGDREMDIALWELFKIKCAVAKEIKGGDKNTYFLSLVKDILDDV